MKDLQSFKQFFKDNLIDDLKILEEERKHVARKIILLSCIYIVIAIILVALFIQIIQLAFVVLIIAITMTYYSISSSYISGFKNLIIKEIINFIDPKLSYSPTSCISHHDFANSELFRSNINGYKGDDRVSGKIGKTEIIFSELNATHTTGSGKNKSTKTIFKGLFFVADFHKNFKTNTFILPDFAEKFFGFLGEGLQSLNKTKGELVKLEDPEFEKNFVVYSNDQIEARYILSPALMARIMDFKKKTKRKIHMSFINNKVYVAIHYKKNLFEPKLFKTLINFKPIQSYFEDLKLATEIVNDLNLNTRIWRN
jgi:hypothetical protein